MDLSNLKFFLKNLISDGHLWQYLDVNNEGSPPKFFFTNPQFVLLLISGCLTVSLGTGINKDFIGYAIASLSLFVGLFLTLILNILDKFLEPKKAVTTEKEKIIENQRLNYFKQFVALTSYSILLALVGITFMSLTLLSDFFKSDIYVYEWVNSISEINVETIKNFLRVTVNVAYRFLLFYFLLDFFLIVLYAVTSIYNYISVEFGKKK